MKQRTYAALMLAGVLSIAASGAFANEGADRVTRAHVLAELQAAEELGLVPVDYVNYPYTPEQAAQLQARTAQIEAAQHQAGTSAQ
ncbi:DUF4148 domain-containing protein [Pandoraea sp.]|uniref:DUF4148 domain-containing protein n=1 Tax=Pandoraea sp. TaxID=1883445 RepID=UPI00122BF3EA|nr:DUF4148 domain-containing protein [Pandoraea sp.]TAL55512.1 MAG: DUF4148 domain-containing protein [Pandoraea sp.]TAM17788.1 MAG: DUF4148 domain-containing protein [Pandoraea sp.]